MNRYIKETSRWIWPSGRLPKLDIEMTERCDNNCIHCCINQPARDIEIKKREMPTSQIKRHLDEAAQLGCLMVRFTGGEPLMRDDFEELYLYARRLGMQVMIFTNARRIRPRLADLFQRIPPLVAIEISVYGMSKQSYEAVTRIPGSHAEFKEGLSELHRRHIPYVVKWAVLPPNRDELNFFRAWAATLPGMTRKSALAVILQLRDRRDSETKNRIIMGLRLDPAESAALLDAETDDGQKELIKFCKRFLGPPGKFLFSCDIGKSPCIDAYGRLQPCLGVRAPELIYDLEQGSLQDAIDNFFPSLQNLKAANPNYLNRCARCFLKSLCEQCPARSWSEQGTLDTPIEYLCEFTHEQAKRLSIISDGEHGWEISDWRLRLK